MKINLPVPQPHHVEEFKRIIRESQGIELTDQEAYEQCANMVKYLFLTEHALPALRKAKEEATSCTDIDSGVEISVDKRIRKEPRN